MPHTMQPYPSSHGSVTYAFLHLFCLRKAKDLNVGREKCSDLVRKDLIRSLVPLLFIALIAALVLCATGRIGIGFVIHWGRLSASLGAFLAGWATWYALADKTESWGGSTPDELARNGVFKILMWPGILLSVVGAAWWP